MLNLPLTKEKMKHIKGALFVESLHGKFVLIFGVTLLTIVSSFIIIAVTQYKRYLKKEAIGVVNEVVAFRSWVANTGVIWVNKLHSEHENFVFLKEYGNENQVFYAKNPALATRELSKIYAKLSHGRTFKVTSDKIRWSGNKPDFFEQRSIKAFQQNKNLTFVEAFEEDNYRYSQPLLVLKSCLRCHGNPEDAFNLLNEAKRLKPNFPEALLLEGEMHIRSKRYDKARQSLEFLFAVDEIPESVFVEAENVLNKLP